MSRPETSHLVSLMAPHLRLADDDRLRIKGGSGLGPVPFLPSWDEQLVLRALTETRHQNHTWINLPQFRLYDGGRIMDLMSISCGEWAGSAARVGYEVKVSRADYRSEMKKPEKYVEVMRYCDEFYYVTPKGLICPTELPRHAGLIEVSQDERKQWYGRWRATTVVRASKRTSIIDRNFFKALAAGVTGQARNPRQTVYAQDLFIDVTKSHSLEHQADLHAAALKNDERERRNDDFQEQQALNMIRSRYK